MIKKKVIFKYNILICLIIFVLISSCNNEIIESAISLNESYFIQNDRFRYQQLMELTRHKNNRFTQGLAISGNCAFVFFTGGYCKLVDLVELKELKETQLESTSNSNHVNCAMFSNSYYINEDKYPLIYVSPGRQCYVERYNEENNTFQLIQTIYVRTSLYSDSFDGEFVVDNQNQYLYNIVKSDKDIRTAVLYIRIFKLPNVTVPQVTLCDKDLIDIKEIKLHHSNILQDGMIYNDYIFLIFGNQNSRKDLYVINTNDFSYECIEMPKTFSSEPEGIAIYGNHIYMSTNFPRGIWDLYEF